jgi:ribosome recycling factor
MKEEIKLYEEKMTKTIHALESEFGSIRAGRANPHVLDHIRVDYYGQLTPLSQLATVAVPEARTLQIQPWDATVLSAIEKAISTSDIGIHPNSDGKVIRLNFPDLTEERRRDLSKEVKRLGEVAKVGIRNIRRDANDHFKKEEKNHDMTEDDLKDFEKEVQNLTDQFIIDIDKHIENKITEITTV